MSLLNARYIWADPAGKGRNRYALFRRGFSVISAKTGTFSIFADTRYRLMVNGQVVGHGPARFFRSNPEYDTYDITPFLRAGRNVIAVIVNSCGGASFHNEASLGGLIAWGEIYDKTGSVIRITTDESWRVTESPGHREDTPHLSSGLNAGEHLDARAMPAGWETTDFDDRNWALATRRKHPEHWGELRPRSIPLLDERKVTPRRRLGAWVAKEMAGEDVYSLMVTTAGGKSLHTNARVAVMTYIHSPREQEATIGAWSGRYWLNGEALTATARTDLALRNDFVAAFKEGWNTFLVYETLRHDWWDFYLALPRSAGLEISAEKEVGFADTFLVGGPWEDELAGEADRIELPLISPADLPKKLGAWRPWTRDRRADTPCRERAWKRFEPLDGGTSLRVDVPALAQRVKDGTLSLLYDLGAEVLGRPVAEFTAAAGTVVDFAYCERLKSDGTADVPGPHPALSRNTGRGVESAEMAERYVAREGWQRWQTFHPKGMRYLEFLIRGDLSRFELHEVALTRANYPVEDIGSFECSDPTLNEIWKIGRETQRACMEDAYVDGAWRERGLMANDLLPQFLVNLASFGDTKLMRRCIELFLLGQGETGLLPPSAHGLPAGRHPDCSAIVPQALWHYWSRTGDIEFLRQMTPGLKRLLAGLEAMRIEGSELLDGSQLGALIDSAHMDRSGVNGALNCFYQRAFHDGSRVLDLVEEKDLAQRYVQQSRLLTEEIRQAFWDEEHGVFVDRLRWDVSAPQPSVAANALPMLYDIATPQQASQAMEWLMQAMKESFRCADPAANEDCNITPYFSFYALGALYKLGKAAEAEEFIRTYWGRMLDQGARTWWDSFLDEGAASRCHGAASSPTHYLSTCVLGVSFPRPGNMNYVEIRPRPGSLHWAQGAYPHAKGVIAVRWEWKNGRLAMAYSAPEGVEVKTISAAPEQRP